MFTGDTLTLSAQIHVVFWKKRWRNKYAFQQDAYRPQAARISQHALREGGVCSWGVCTWVGVCLRGVSQHAMGQTPPYGQTDTCENITFANFVYGR